MLAALLADTSGQALAHASAWAVYGVGAALIITGAFGVILLRNPVHCALMLVVTFFGIMLEFLNQGAYFLAVVQIIVYAGAVVILFLFVIMFLGVDRKEAIGAEPTRFQRPLAIVLGLVALGEILALSRVDHWTSGAHSQSGALSGAGQNVQKLGQSIYTGYLLPFEMTAALLLIAVVAAVVMSRRGHPSAGEMSERQQRDLLESPIGSADGRSDAGAARPEPVEQPAPREEVGSSVPSSPSAVKK